MKYLKVIVVVCFLLFLSNLSTAENQNVSIFQVIIDNSAALQNKQEVTDVHKKFFYKLSELRRNPNLKNKIVYIISINDPQNLWVGEIKDLKKDGDKILKKIRVIENGCSDLVDKNSLSRTESGKIYGCVRQ